MKNLTKIFSLLFVLAMILSFAACSDDSSKRDKDDDDDDDRSKASIVTTSHTSDDTSDTSNTSDDVSDESENISDDVSDESEEASVPETSEPDVSEPDISEPDVSEPDVSEPDVDNALIGEWQGSFNYIPVLEAALGMDVNDEEFMIPIIYVFDENGNATASIGEIDEAEKAEFIEAYIHATYDFSVSLGFAGTLDELIEAMGGRAAMEQLIVEEYTSVAANNFTGEYVFEDGVISVDLTEVPDCYVVGTVDGEVITLTGFSYIDGEFEDVGFPIIFNKVA